MLIKQISVFLENKSGRLNELINAIGKANIDISALSLADTDEYGIVRMIVDNTEKAVEIIREIGIIVKVTDVIAVPIGNAPGSLAKVLSVLEKEEISVSYIYAFMGKTENEALCVFKTSDLKETEKVLKDNKIINE